jgi:hypothetical protein
MYSVFSILLLYIYQLPVQFPYVVLAFADFIGLFKVSSKSEWPELSSGISLLVYYFMVSIYFYSMHNVKYDVLVDRIL